MLKFPIQSSYKYPRSLLLRWAANQPIAASQAQSALPQYAALTPITTTDIIAQPRTPDCT